MEIFAEKIGETLLTNEILHHTITPGGFTG